MSADQSSWYDRGRNSWSRTWSIVLRRQTAVALIVGLGGITRVLAGEPLASFHGLGDFPGGEYSSIAYAVSADGRVVVGASHSHSGQEAARWVDRIMYPLGDLPGGPFSSVARDVSGDGRIVVGYGTTELPNNPQVTEAFRYEVGGSMVSLGRLNGVNSQAHAISSDGRVIVGIDHSAAGSQAVRWIDGEIEPLGDFPGGLFVSSANAVTDDGSVIVGFGHESPQGAEVAIWDTVGIHNLHDLPGGAVAGYGEAVSADGAVVVGASQSDRGSEAFRFQDGEMVALGDPPGGTINGWAYAVSADGSVIVGRGDTGRPDSGGAFVWDGEMHILYDMLVHDYGLDLGEWKLEAAHDISADGTVIVGYGTNPDGNQEGRIATIPVRPTIVRSDPPSGTIDARQDFSTSGRTPQGITRVRIKVSSPVKHLVSGGDLDATSFAVDATANPPPVILDVVKVIDDPGTVATYDVIFEDPLPAGGWTTIRANVARSDGQPVEPPSDRVLIGFLPADVNASGTANAVDVLDLIDDLNGILDPPLAVWQCDTDRSGVCGAPDVLRVIDLLNGAATSRPWNNVRLPPKPE